MPVQNNEHTFLNGLSDFWQRFFADSEQLKALYRGSEILIGQAYLDLLSNVLNQSLIDCPVFNKELWRLITIREDELTFQAGATVSDNVWVYHLADDVVKIPSLDNKIISPTAAFEESQDFSIGQGVLNFNLDPTDPNNNGTPTPGFALRQLDIAVDGQLSDASATSTWMARGVKKGDILRKIDQRLTQQVKIKDYSVAIVRAKYLYLKKDTTVLPIQATETTKFVVLRKQADHAVSQEQLTFALDQASTLHTRLEQGSVRIYSKSVDGVDVKEGLDYTVDYEAGIIRKLNPIARPWQVGSTNKIDYEWRKEIWPSTGVSPRLSITGLLEPQTTTGVNQLAFWVPDILVDRKALGLTFGSLIGFVFPSSENYKAFLKGLFQLYILGPVLERIESALNVIFGFPVIRDDGEIFQTFSVLPTVTRITTLRTDGSTGTYDYPLVIPIRSDINVLTPLGSITFSAFEALTKAATVTDYIQDPTWWHNILLPENLFSTLGGATIPSFTKRVVAPDLIENKIDPADGASIGDPGFYIGADDEGNVLGTGHKGFRHRLSFVLMDRFLKTHIFYVRLDPNVFSTLPETQTFANDPNQISDILLAAKPAYTYAYIQPVTEFSDLITISEDALFVGNLVGMLNQFLYVDRDLQINTTAWNIGDFFHYELFTDAAVNFPVLGVPVTLLNAPPGPRTARLVKVRLSATIASNLIVENIDYSVDYTNRTVTRLTVWDVNISDVAYLQLNIGNISALALDPTVGDTPYVLGNMEPELIRAAYDPAALDPNSVLWPVNDHRDMSMVERRLTIAIL